jgi:DNA-binding LacI/PurR family transcriptional regulator
LSICQASHRENDAPAEQYVRLGLSCDNLTHNTLDFVAQDNIADAFKLTRCLIEGGIRAFRQLIRKDKQMTGILSLDNRMTLGVLSEMFIRSAFVI